MKLKQNIAAVSCAPRRGWLSRLSAYAGILMLGAALSMTGAAADPPAVQQKTAPAAVQTVPFDGASIYREAFEALRDKHRELRDPAVRAKFVAEWQNKHANDDMLKTEAGTDRAIFEMVWSLGQRFDYYNPPAAAKAEADRINATMAGVGMPVGMKGRVAALKALNEREKAGEKLKPSDFEPIGKISDERQMWVPEAPYEGTPAEKAGIKKGDVITHVDGASLNGKTLDEAVKLIRGPVGTKVKLTIKRQGEFADSVSEVEITRAQVQVRAVRSEQLSGGITHIKMEHFSSQYGDQEMYEALSKAVAAGTKGIIIDLRGNPGGFLHQVMNISEMLINKGTVLKQVSRKGDYIETTSSILTPAYAARVVEVNDGKTPRRETRFQRTPLVVPSHVPVVIMINEGSASASEILAGALQANGRATIIGEPTHGKGVGQEMVFIDKKKRNLHVTTFEFLPGGEVMDWIGIVPDVEVKLPEFVDIAENPSSDTQLNQARAEILGRIMGLPMPVRDAAELAKRRDELKKSHEADFAKEVEMRKKILASPVGAKDEPASDE
ncbi:MAG: PDZ domain-containing protein [Candidatus Obscuribacterales bacterium]|nr:PDZ domain-containing protein [Candidatus Obscuribacterales bacterium]